MKLLFKFFTLLCLAVLAGCATTKQQQTESMLSAAGFKTQIATTPQQQAHLATLPPYKLFPVKRKGVVYFVYADKAHNQILIGKQAQYTAYEQMVQAQQQAKEDESISRWNAETADMNEAAAEWDSWGVWEPLYPYPYPVYP